MATDETNSILASAFMGCFNDEGQKKLMTIMEKRSLKNGDCLYKIGLIIIQFKFMN